MELILNTESLFGQYPDEQAFLDNITENMLPCLKLAQERNISVKTDVAIYRLQVCPGKTFGNIIDKYPLGDAEIQKLKRILYQLEPEKEYILCDDFFQFISINKLSLLSFYPSKNEYKNLFFISTFKNEKVRNAWNRKQLVTHLIELKYISYPDSSIYTYVINPEDNEKHHEPHFHLSAGGKESSVRIEDFETASKKSIHRSLIAGVELAKKYKKDLIEIWDFHNPKYPFSKI